MKKSLWVWRLFAAFCIFALIGAAQAETVYNNFGPGNEGFEYNTGMSWMIAGHNSYFDYVEQAHSFTPGESGYLSDIYIGLMEVLGVNECTVRLLPDCGETPSMEDVMETWLLHSDDLPSGGGGEPRPATQLVSAVQPYLTAGQSYSLWVQVDVGSSASWGENVTGAIGHMQQFVWVDEHYQYEWVDMPNGYALGAMRVDIFDGTPPPTATPTATDTPTITPTPTSTPTATPTGPTPTPTATPLVNTAYNNFGPGNEGFEYNTSESWMIAGNNSYFNYVEQAHAFTSSESGPLAYIYIGLMEVLGVNECTVRLVPDNGETPSEDNALETWLLHADDLPSGGGGEPRPATQLISVVHPYLTAGQSYWIWVKVDLGSSASWGENVTGAIGHMQQFVWVDEHYQYEWVDMGNQAIGALRIDVIADSPPATATPTDTVTPWPTNTPTPTPEFPTNTPTPTAEGPTNTPTPTAEGPTNTPTPTAGMPTNTPDPTCTPTTGCAELGVRIVMPSNYFVEGDPFSTYIDICNPGPDQYTNIPLFVILDVYGQLFFAPDFDDFDFFTINYLDIGTQQVEVLPEFTWPGDIGESSGIMWYAGMTDEQMTVLLGLMDSFEFGWGY